MGEIALNNCLDHTADSLAGAAASVWSGVTFDKKDAAGLRVGPTLHGRGSIGIAFPDFDDLCVLVCAFELDLAGLLCVHALGYQDSPAGV